MTWTFVRDGAALGPAYYNRWYAVYNVGSNTATMLHVCSADHQSVTNFGSTNIAIPSMTEAIFTTFGTNLVAEFLPLTTNMFWWPPVAAALTASSNALQSAMNENGTTATNSFASLAGNNAFGGQETFNGNVYLNGGTFNPTFYFSPGNWPSFNTTAGNSSTPTVPMFQFANTNQKFTVYADGLGNVTVSNNLTASNITATTGFNGPATGLTSIPAGQLTGTVPSAALGTQLTLLSTNDAVNQTNIPPGGLQAGGTTPSSSTFYRGDGTWQPPGSGSGIALVGGAGTNTSLFSPNETNANFSGTNTIFLTNQNIFNVLYPGDYVRSYQQIFTNQTSSQTTIYCPTNGWLSNVMGTLRCTISAITGCTNPGYGYSYTGLQHTWTNSAGGTTPVTAGNQAGTGQATAGSASISWGTTSGGGCYPSFPTGLSGATNTVNWTFIITWEQQR
jgi:hypothetical protein